MKYNVYNVEYHKKDSVSGDTKIVGTTTVFVFEGQNVGQQSFLSAPNQECRSATKLVYEKVN